MASDARIVILTEGNTEPLRAKTATSVIRYRTKDVVAVLDSTQAGKSAGELLGVGGDLPIVGSLDDANSANTLLIGIAPSGGKIPANWRSTIRQAIERGWTIVSGLHEHLANDAEFSALAETHGSQLQDVRRNFELDVADGNGFRPGCLRILTVGQDCSVGKMVTSIEIAKALAAEGHDAQFVATGQTGIMIAGAGCPVDGVIADFLNGAVERLIRANESHAILVIEGQGSLAHPRYSPVTLGLLHGARPQGLVLCYEAERPHVSGMPNTKLVSLEPLVDAYQCIAQLVADSRVIGVALNGRRLDAREAAVEVERVESRLGIPVCDVYRDGAAKLANATLQLQKKLGLAE